MTLTREVCGVAIAAAFAIATPAYGQVNYYTQGFFTSGAATCNATPPVVGAPQNAVCSGAGFSLAYTAVPLNPGPIASGSVVSLGQFLLTGMGDVTVVPPQVEFTLFIRQLLPDPGLGQFDGYISGTVTTDGPNGDFSSLMWRPNQSVGISTATYQMIFDNLGYAAGVGLAIPINQTRGINALINVTTVPEPATVVLMAGGLTLLGFMARRFGGQVS